MKFLTSRIWVSLSLAFILSIPYVYRFTSAQNRYEFHWNIYESIALNFSIIIIGMLFYFFFFHIQSTQRKYLRYTSDFLFSLVFIIALMSNIDHFLYTISFRFEITKDIYKIPDLVSILGLAVGIVLAILNLNRFKKFAISVCLILSFSFPIFIVTSAFYENYYANKGSISNANNIEISDHINPRSVFIIIFDEWSYHRTFCNKKLIDSFQNLKKIRDSSIIFHNAISLDSSTFGSMPKLLFQTNSDFKPTNRRITFIDKGQNEELKKTRSIFSTAKNMGYFNAICGFYHPYAQFFEKDVDFILSISNYKRWGDSFIGSSANHILGIFTSLPRLYKSIGIERLNTIIHTDYGIRRLNKIHAASISIMESSALNIFAVFHYPIPHSPFLFGKDGPKDIISYKEQKSIEAYEDNLAYTDVIIGEILDILRSTNRFENSLLIFTSDHSWRTDPEQKHQEFNLAREGQTILAKDLAIDITEYVKRHVPLIVRIPKLNRGFETSILFTANHLEKFVEFFLSPNYNSANIDQIIERIINLEVSIQ